MKVSAGTRGSEISSNRQVTIRVTGLANNSYVRSSDCVMEVPYSSMSKALQLVQRLGGKITNVQVSGAANYLNS